jgi:ankyrin repeat protein
MACAFQIFSNFDFIIMRLYPVYYIFFAVLTFASLNSPGLQIKIRETSRSFQISKDSLQTLLILELCKDTIIPLSPSNFNSARIYNLIKSGADPNTRSLNGTTPLMIAAFCNNIKLVNILIELNVDVNACNDAGKSALNAAIQINSLIIAKILLKHHIYVNAKDIYGSSPLHQAANVGSPEMVQLLVYHGASVNEKDEKGQTPLFRAIWHGHLKSLKILLKNGAIVNVKDTMNSTPLDLAVMKGDEQKVRLLLQYGAKINTDNTYSTWDWLIDNADTSIALLMVNHNFDVNARNISGNTPLYRSVENDNKYLVKIFLEHHANVNMITFGKTPLDIAKSEEIITLLKFYGAKTSAELNIQH